jgi:hypothetical protein
MYTWLADLSRQKQEAVFSISADRVSLKIIVFWDVTPYRSLRSFQRNLLPPSSGLMNKPSVEKWYGYTKMEDWDGGPEGEQCIGLLFYFENGGGRSPRNVFRDLPDIAGDGNLHSHRHNDLTGFLLFSYSVSRGV